MRTDIEYAALVMGKTFEWYCRGANNPKGVANVPCLDGEEWKPLHDDGDSRRLEIACLRWMMDGESVVPPSVWQHDSRLDGARIAGNADEYRAAVFALAVAIGKTISAGDAMEGNDNAGYLAGAIGKVMEDNDNAD